MIRVEVVRSFVFTLGWGLYLQGLGLRGRVVGQE